MSIKTATRIAILGVVMNLLTNLFVHISHIFPYGFEFPDVSRFLYLLMTGSIITQGSILLFLMVLHSKQKD